jgi:hypothetical protein
MPNPTVTILGSPETASYISHLDIAANVLPATDFVVRRAMGGYHDLLALFGPQDQNGSVRKSDGSLVIQNPRYKEPFYAVDEGLRVAENQYRRTHPDSVLIGAGCAYGLQNDAFNFLQVRRLGVYWAGSQPLIGDFVQESTLGSHGFYVSGDAVAYVRIPNSKISVTVTLDVFRR